MLFGDALTPLKYLPEDPKVLQQMVLDEHLPDLAKSCEKGLMALSGAHLRFQIRLEMDEHLAAAAVLAR